MSPGARRGQEGVYWLLGSPPIRCCVLEKGLKPEEKKKLGWQTRVNVYKRLSFKFSIALEESDISL